MNKKNLVKIINKELTILSDIVNDFSGNDQIHTFEIDLALQKAKDIYGELLLLKGDGESIPKKVAQDLDSKLAKQSIAKKSDAKIPEIKVSLAEEPKKAEEILTVESEEVEVPVDVECNVDVETVANVDDTAAVENEISAPEETIVVEQNPAQDEMVSNNPEPKVENPVEDTDEELPYKVESFTPKAEPIIEDKKEVEPEIPKVAAQVIVQESTGKAQNTIVADRFQNQSPSLNDSLAGIKQHKDLASSLKEGPIKDLKAAIKLNDRIWFTNELFNKNSELFNKTLVTINQSADLDAALAHVFTNFTWDQNKKSTISFLELVFRRFAK
jgi:hypothetical protein